MPSMVSYANISGFLVKFELFQILGAVFKQYKVTNQQMDTGLSLIKAPKLKIIKINPKTSNKN